MPICCASNLVKTHGVGRAALRVLDGVDLELQAGEVVAIVGRSGSGKSTLLHLLGALDRPDSGSIELAGTRLDSATEQELTRIRRLQIGFVFQSFHLLPELTGMDNVLLPARLGGGQDAITRGIALVAELGLTEEAERLPSVLSGGEQQRLAVARALVNDPSLLLADEPTGNLDPESGAEVLGLLQHAAAAGKAVLLVTHQDDAIGIADRVLHLSGGRLVE
ncbi:MAG: ABC transporter ATP-binding protein [Thermoleophilia bacterium]|nr:ABC transporter ATP-binding protein [Thermoleophilia bacterium]